MRGVWKSFDKYYGRLSDAGQEQKYGHLVRQTTII